MTVRRVLPALVLAVLSTWGFAGSIPSFGHASAIPGVAPSHGSTPTVAPPRAELPFLLHRAPAPSIPRPSAGTTFGEVGLVAAGTTPTEMAYDSGTGEVYVSNDGGSNVTVISDATNTVVATVNVGSAPLGLAYDSKRSEIFVANIGTDNVSVISDSTHRVVATITLPAGTNPSTAVYDPDTNEVWVIGYNSRISVVADSNNTVVSSTTLPVRGLGLVAGTYDSGKGEIFVSSFNASFVFVFWGTNASKWSAIPVGTNPWGLAYDAAKGWIYVADEGQSRVSVISDSTNATIATGIGVIGGPLGVAYDPSDGYIFVTDQNDSLTTIIADATNTQVGHIPNIYGGSPWGVVWDSARAAGFVADSMANLVEEFGRVSPVLFVAVGLPTGTPWTVWMNSSSTPYGPQHVEWFSTGPILNTTEPNGTYTFSVSTSARFVIHPPSGPITVAGATVRQTIEFDELFNVTFTESGLASGTPWSVTLNGTTVQSTTSSLVASVVNGSYAFTVAPIPGYEATPTGGSLTMSGTPLTRAITFSLVFPLWFNETGLPTSTNWSVTIVGSGSFSGSMTGSSKTSSVEFLVGPGYTGTYSISRPTGYEAQPGAGTVSTSSTGAPDTVAIAFSANPSIDTFTAAPSPVTIGAQLSFHVAVSGGLSPLTYSYVQLPAGCASQNSSSLVCAPTATGLSVVIVTVSDRLGRTAEANVSINVNPATSSSTVLGLPPTEGYGLIGGIIVVVAIAAILALMMRRKSSIPPPNPAPSPAPGGAPPASPGAATPPTTPPPT